MPRRVLLPRALWVGVALGLLVYLALTVWLALAGTFFPYQLDYGEGIVLWFTHELALGHTVYKGLEGLPYASSNYPPLAMLLAAPFRALLGDSYIGGRWLNFAATLITTALIFRLVREETSAANGRSTGAARRGRQRGYAAAALGALFFLGSTFTYHWIPLFRIDLIGLAFSVAGIFFVWRWQRQFDDRNRRRAGRGLRGGRWAAGSGDLAAAILLFLCAFYTKQSLVFAPAAAFVAIFLRDRRAAVSFALALGIVGGAVFVALDALTRGGFAFGLITSNATQWLWNTFATWTTDFLYTFFVLLVLAAWGWWTRVRDRRIGILETYGAAALASLALAGRVGAYENYFFEAIVAVCLFAGLAIARWLQRPSPAPLWLPLALLAQLALYVPEHNPGIALALMEVTRSSNEQVAPLVQAARGIVISEDMGLLVTNGKPVDYYTFQYSSLARAGEWNQQWELENLRTGQFPLVILFDGTREDVDHYRNFTREFVSALDYAYAVTTQTGRYQVYTPAPLEHLRQANFDGKLELIGWSLSPGGGARAGQQVTLTLVSCAERGLPARYTAFAHLEDAQGVVIAQDDHEPDEGAYPTTNWAANEMVRDTFRLRLPANLAPGTYSLRVGWYDSATQDRLNVKGGGDFVELEQLQVE